MVDWAGRLVEHLTGQRLEAFIRENISKPLGLKTLTFFPQQHPELLKTRAEMTIRTSLGQLEHSDETYWYSDPEDAFGGMALYASPADFFAVLSSLLLDDEQLLSSATLNEFLKTQLSNQARENMAMFLSNKQYNDSGMGALFPYGSQRDHALAGMLLLEDLPEEDCPRRPGTVGWMGLPNFYWVSI